MSERAEFLEYATLESFCNSCGYEISRATITRYGQIGVMLDPKRKNKRLSPADARVYYNPLVVIEVITAYCMFAGAYICGGASAKMARFTAADVFWARINFYANHYDELRNHGLGVKDYVTSVRIPENNRYRVQAFAMDHGILDKLMGLEPFSVDDETAELNKLWDIHQQYINNFKYSNQNLFNLYSNVVNTIYEDIFFELLKQYAYQLNKFEY